MFVSLLVIFIQAYTSIQNVRKLKKILTKINKFNLIHYYSKKKKQIQKYFKLLLSRLHNVIFN